MPREINFKGKRLDNGEVVYGYAIEIEHNDDKSHTHTAIIEKPLLEYPTNGVFQEVIPETVGEYAGHQDKNGVDIYEKDKLHIEITDYSTGKVIVSADEEVIFQDGCFGVIWGSYRNFKALSAFSKTYTTFEVIGEAV